MKTVIEMVNETAERGNQLLLSVEQVRQLRFALALDICRCDVDYPFWICLYCHKNAIHVRTFADGRRDFSTIEPKP